MSSQEFARSHDSASGEEEVEVTAHVPVSSDDQALDSLLDEIDDVLETNAETFVKSFVQKGGQ